MVKHSRFIAFLLATVFILSAPGPIGVVGVQAAEQLNFALSYEGALVESIPNSSAPKYSSATSDLTENDDRTPKVLAKWDFILQGTYYLRYHMDDGQQILLRVTKEGDEKAEVSYRVLSTTSAALIVPSTYTVYSRANSGFIDYSQVPDTDSNWLASRSSDGTAVFTITKDSGFTIRYNGKKIHFYWNVNGRMDDTTGYPDQNKFFVTTSGARAGKVYDFELYYTGDRLYAANGGDVAWSGGALLFPADPNATKSVDDAIPITPLASAQSGALKVMTGFTNVNSEPIANAYTNAHGIDGANELYRPASNGGTDDDWPGSDKVNLKMSFDLPLQWDAATSTFTVPNSQSAGEAFPDITLWLTNRQSDMRVTFSDITGAVSATPSGNGFGLEGPTRNGNKLSFYLTGLQAGQIFTTAIYLSKMAAGLLLKTTNVDFGKVYTYMPYEIRAVDDQFYVFVTPYQGHSGHYLLKINNKAVFMVESNGSETVKLSANSVLGQLDYYQVFFSTSKFSDIGEVPSSSPLLHSQVLYYIPTLSDTTIGNPNNFQVVDYQLRFNKTNTDEGDLDLTLAWDVLKANTLKNLAPSASNPLEIEYELRSALTMGADYSSFTTVKIAITNEDGAATFSDSEGKLISGKLIPYTDPVSGYICYKAQVNLTVKAARAFDVGGTVDFLFPKIYFLNVFPLSVNGVEEKALTESQYGSITLNEYEVPQMPAAQNLSSAGVVTTNEYTDGTDEVSIKIKWSMPIENLKTYLEYLYEGSTGPYDDDILAYNLYISQDERKMSSFATEEDRNLRTSKEGGYVAATNDRLEDALYVSGINGVTDILMIEGKELREALRAKEAVIGINGIPVNDTTYNLDNIMNSSPVSGSALTISYTLDGLDKNQKYYMAVEAVVKSPAGEDEEFQYSRLSSILGETTKGDPEIMDPSESDPPASFFKEYEVEEVTASLTWDRIEDNLSVEAESTDYQIIRVKDSPLDDSVLGKTSFSFDENSSILGLQTDGQRLQLYSNGTFTNLTETDLYELNTDADPPTLKLYDRTLSTNSIYYYYIRTKRVVNNSSGKPVTRYSQWNGVSLTSDPVKFPINLKVEQDMAYDRYTETIISFDAPIPDPDTLGTEYELQYQLKADDGGWGGNEPMVSSELTSSVSATEGYRHYVYKIRSLKPNTLYSIRVRVADLIKKDYSTYSNVAQAKTNFRQEDYDKDHTAGTWMDYLEEMLNKLLKDPYWVSKDTSSLFEVVYRPTMFDALLAQNTGGLLQLAESNADKSVYYLPASAVITANSRNVGFKISYDDMDMIFSPKAVNTDYNDAVLSIAAKIDEQSVSDYYIRITVSQTTVSSIVEGDQPLTKQAAIAVEAVGSRENTAKWDKSIITLFTGRAADYISSSPAKQEIIDALEDKVSDEEFVKLVDDIVNELRRDFIKEVSSKLSSATRHSYSLDHLDASLILMTKGLDPAASVKAYQLVSGSYISYEVTNFGDNKAVYTTAPGVYIFAGRVILVHGLDNLTGAGSLAGIIGKYGLDDLFGRDGAFSLEAFATRYQIVGSIARMAGAPKGAEPFAWLSQNKGLTISARNSSGNVQAQEAVYLVMALYEIRTGTKVAAIQIRNYSLTAGITDLSESYKQSVRAAFELDICGNSGFNPKSGIKVKEFLEMLSALDAKSRL